MSLRVATAPTPRTPAAPPAVPVRAISRAYHRRRRDEPSLSRHALLFIKEVSVVAVGAMLVSTLLRLFVGQIFEIPSESMQNTLLISDRVLVEKVTPLDHGDIVVFRDPGGWVTDRRAVPRGQFGQVLEYAGLLPTTSSEHVIKRVFGLPGDRVICCDYAGRLSINFVPLDEESFQYTEADGTRAPASPFRFDVTVPKDHIFVIGDNRLHSRDSRCHLNDEVPGKLRGEVAFISEELVVGRAFAVVWPKVNARRLKIPATFAAVGPATDPAPADPVIWIAKDEDRC